MLANQCRCTEVKVCVHVGEGSVGSVDSEKVISWTDSIALLLRPRTPSFFQSFSVSDVPFIVSSLTSLCLSLCLFVPSPESILSRVNTLSQCSWIFFERKLQLYSRNSRKKFQWQRHTQERERERE
jgi:hypothetical protein